MVQAANRFILDDLAASWAESSVVAWPEHEKLKSFLQDVFLPTVKTQQTCLSCHHVSTRESKGLVVDLVYPRKPFVHEQAVKQKLSESGFEFAICELEETLRIERTKKSWKTGET